MILKLLDVSNILYIGNSSKYKISRGIREVDGAIEANVAQAGAIRYLISFIQKIREPDCVIVPVMDREPLVKREEYGKVFGDTYGYKAGRPRVLPNDVTKQQMDTIKWYAEKLLEDCDFEVVYADGYEADDIIYTLWKDNVEYFDKVEIYTSDADLSFMVGPNTEIMPNSKNGKHITIANYEYTVKKNQYTKYNGINFYKLFSSGLADKSDNIDGVGDHWNLFFQEVMRTPQDWTMLHDLDVCRAKLATMKVLHPDEINANRLVETFNLLVPYYVEDIESTISKDNVNWNRFEDYYLNHFNSNSTYQSEISEDLLEEFVDSFNS